PFTTSLRRGSLRTAHSFATFIFSICTPPAEIYTLSLHDALPISAHLRRHLRSQAPGEPAHPVREDGGHRAVRRRHRARAAGGERSEEHTSELQSPYDLVCRLLLEKKKYNALSVVNIY